MAAPPLAGRHLFWLERGVYRMGGVCTGRAGSVQDGKVMYWTEVCKGGEGCEQDGRGVYRTGGVCIGRGCVYSTRGMCTGRGELCTGRMCLKDGRGQYSRRRM